MIMPDAMQQPTDQTVELAELLGPGARGGCRGAIVGALAGLVIGLVPSVIMYAGAVYAGGQFDSIFTVPPNATEEIKQVYTQLRQAYEKSKVIAVGNAFSLGSCITGLSLYLGTFAGAITGGVYRVGAYTTDRLGANYILKFIDPQPLLKTLFGESKPHAPKAME